MESGKEGEQIVAEERMIEALGVMEEQLGGVVMSMEKLCEGCRWQLCM